MYLLSTVLSFIGPAGACPGSAGEVADGAVAPGTDDACVDARPPSGEAKVDPARSARQPDLVGPEACSWTTSMMAQRVLEQGTPWTYVGRLTAAVDALPSKVASPFTLGPDQRIHVVANQTLEHLQRSSGEPVTARSRVELTGRVLEVDGITYFVATALVPESS
jgi:hypothetical protein